VNEHLPLPRVGKFRCDFSNATKLPQRLERDTSTVMGFGLRALLGRRMDRIPRSEHDVIVIGARPASTASVRWPKVACVPRS
jgi:hypothetical protein